MIVPAVGVVIGDHNGRIVPVFRLLQLVDCVDDEGLFVDRVRIARMAVLIGRCLQEGDGRQVAVLQRRLVIGQVILMVSAAILRRADGIDRGRALVVEIGRRLVILEGLVMRDIVVDLDARHRSSGRTGTARRAVGILRRQVEAALEEAPGDAGFVHQVADIAALHQPGRIFRARTDIAGRVEVGNHRPVAVSVRHDTAAVIGAVLLQLVARRQFHAVGLAGDEVDRAGRRGTEIGREGIVAHGVMLGIVP